MTDINIQDLSAWDNVAPRTYTGRVLCFPFNENARKRQSESAQSVLNLLRKSLDALAYKRPDFAGKLQLGTNLTAEEKQSVTKYRDGHVYLLTSSDYTIYLRPKCPKELEPLYYGVTATNGTETVKMKGINFDRRFIEYDALKEAKFPAKPFINEDLTTDLTLEQGQPPIPVVEVEVVFLKGGFFFNLLIHHTYFDGKAYHMFLEYFAACTRGRKFPQFSTSPMARLPYEFPQTSLAGVRFEDVLPLCSEFQLSYDFKGPTQPIMPPIPYSDRPRNDTKIFVFSFSKLKTLSIELAQINPRAPAPSAYTTLSALLWAHTLAAREAMLSDPNCDPSERAFHAHFFSRPPFFSTPVDWSSTKLLQKYPYMQGYVHNYFGNTVTWATLGLRDASLLRDIATSGNKTALACIASAITNQIAKVNPEYLYTREALFDKVPDMRLLGLTWDPRMPAEWGMNSWADFGSDIEWLLPCVARGNKTLADAQRRVQKEVGGSGGLILPAQKARPENWECQVSLPEGAMRALERDEVFRGYWEEVIG